MDLMQEYELMCIDIDQKTNKANTFEIDGYTN